MKTEVLGSLKKGLAFVVSAPAGTGKTTLVNMLVQEFPCVVESVSYTTRKIRPEEVNGVHYQFMNPEEFESKIARNEFLEYVKFVGYYYGTSLKQLEELQNSGKHVVLVIDTQGALKLIHDKFPATYIFIEPPSLGVLRERLQKRHTENNEVIEERLNWATKEMEAAKKYDYRIINDDLAVAYQVLRSIFIAEEHKVKKN